MRIQLITLSAGFFLLQAQEQGAVDGIARNPASNEPIAGVSCTLRPGDAGLVAILQTTTDAEGHFQLTGLKAGNYELDCQKAGFIRFMQWVTIGTGTAKVDTKMAHGGRVAGRVLCGDKQTAAGIPVELRHRGGRPRYTAVTAKDGSFAFDSLPPARYLLCAGCRGIHMPKSDSLRMPDPTEAEGVTMGWAPVFFPGVPTAAEAQPLTLRTGMDLLDYDLRLISVPLFHVRGKAVDERGDAVGNAELELFGADAWFGAEYQAKSRADGGFDFPGVRVGDWTLRGSALQKSVTLRGRYSVSLVKRDLERVEVELFAPFTLEGFVDRDEPRDREGKRKLTGVTLLAEDDGFRIGPTFHDQDGKLEIDGVYPGRYRIFPLGFLPDWYLESVRLGEQEVLKNAVELRPGSPHVRVIYKPRAGRVRGTVDRGVGAQVVLLPADEELWDGQFIRTAKAGSGGQFEVGSLRPGEYIAFAFEEQQNIDEFSDAALVRALMIHGVKVTARQGEVSEVALRITPGGIQ